MKTDTTMKHSAKKPTILSGRIAVALALLTAPSAKAATLYWDLNGTTANVAVAATGAWNGTNLFWNTIASGTGGTPQAGTTTADDLVFSSGTLYTTGTVTASGARAASSITFEDPIVMTLAGAVTIGGTGTKSGIFALSTATANSTVSGALTLGAASTIQNAGTGVLAITGGITGAFNLTLQNNGATANGVTISGTSLNNTGTVTSSGTGGGSALISAIIGASVTNVIQNSATSQLTLSGTNAYTGTTTASAGILSFTTSLAMPGYSTSPVTAFGTFASPRMSASSGATIAFPFGAATNAITNTNVTGFLDGTYNIFAAGSSLGIDTTNASTSPANLTAVITDTLAGQLGFTKTGTNALTVNAANTYTGKTLIANGTLSVPAINNVGALSGPMGAPTTVGNATISLGFGSTTGTLSYTGAGETTDRVINLAGTTGGGGLDASGAGLVKFTSGLTIAAGAKTLTLSGAGNGEISGTIPGTISTGGTPLVITKAGAGTWTLSGTGNTATRVVISGGTLATGVDGLTLGNLGAGTVATTGAVAGSTVFITGRIILGGVGLSANGADIGAAANTTLDMSGAIIAGVAAGNLDFNPSGTLILGNANTYQGQTQFVGTTVNVTSLGTADGAAPSSLGQPAAGNSITGNPNSTIMLQTGTLRYVGTGETTDRGLDLRAAATVTTIDQSGVSGLLKFTGPITATGAGVKAMTLTGSTEGTGEIATAIVDNSTTNTTGVTKAGTGRWTLSGVNTYTGPTTVSGGNLILSQGGGTGVLGNTGIVINDGGILSPIGGASGYFVGNTATAAAGGRLTLNSLGVLNLADGVINPFVLIQNSTFVGNAATFAGGAISFDIGSALGSNDQIDVRLNNATGTGLATSSGATGIAIAPVAGVLSLAPGAYTLIKAAGTLNNSNFYIASPNLILDGTLYNLSLGLVGTNEVLTVATGGAAAAPNLAYWQGTQADGKWNTLTVGSTTNWSTSLNGNPDTFALPTSNTNVIFAANSATNLSTTLEQNFTINSLAFTGAGATIGSGTGANSLTINAAALNGNALGNGITVLAGAGANTISAPVILGGNQTWTNNATNPLTLSGGISGTATLATAGSGTIVISGASSYFGTTTIGAGSTLRLDGTAGSFGTGDVTNSGILQVNRTNAYNLGHAISGAGTFTQLGTGTTTLSGASSYTGTTTVTAGTLTVTGSTNQGIAASDVLIANTAAGNAVLNIQGAVTARYLSVGGVTGASGAVYMNSGTYTGGADIELGFTFGAGVTTGGYGYLGMTGGTVNTNRFQFGSQNVPAQNGVGVGLISGGTVNAGSYVILSRYGTTPGTIGTLTVATGGTLNHTSATAGQNFGMGWQGAGRAELNLTGGVITSATGRTLGFGAGGALWTGTGIVNLDAGTLTTTAITTAGTGASSYLNFNGGTLKAVTTQAAFLPALTGVYVNGAFGSFSGNSTIDNNNVAITIAAPLIAPTGSGVATIPVTAGGSGYIGAPAVSITDGGSGFGATAIANMVDDGTGNGTFKIGSITITNPGNNYTAPSVAFVGGGNGVTVPTLGTLTTALNSSGNLGFTGASVTTLSGVNTFTGNIALNTAGGTLALANTVSQSIVGNISGDGNLSQTGAGTTTLSSAVNSYTGITTISAGTLQVATLANGGSTSSIGQSTNAAANLVFSGGTLAYTGGSVVSDRAFAINAAATGTINVSNAATTLSLPGATGAVTTGALTKTGPGALTLSGANTYNGNTTVSGGMLNITGSLTGLAATTNLAYGGTVGNTIVNISGSGSINNYKNFTGANVAGSIAVMNQTGGNTSTLGTNGQDTQWVAQNGGYGYLNITGGTFNTGRFDAVGATGGGTAVVYVGGGGTFNNNSGDWLILPRNAGVGQLTVGPGGSLVRTAAVTANLGITMDASNARGALNIAGGTVDTGVRPINFGFGSAAFTNTRGFVNLAGGTLSVGAAILQSNTNAGGQYFEHFNFVGGTLKSNAAITWLPAASAVGHTITATIYGAATNNNNANAAFNTQIGTSSNFTGGLTVDTNGFATTIAQPLRGASGFGVTQADIGDLSLLAGNSGYIGAPSVVFSAPASPTGVPASGYAAIDTITGKVTGIVITNPGTYASGEAPTITLSGGGGSITPITTPVLATANVSGGLTKIGAGTLTLSGANTYTGGTTVSGGTLALGANNVLTSVGGLTVSSTGTFDVVTFNSTVASVTLQGSGTIIGSTGVLTSTATYDVQSGAVNFSGTGGLAGSVGLTKTTGGTVTLSNGATGNVFTGAVNVNAGTLAFSASNNLGDNSATNTIGINGGTLSYSGVGASALGAAQIVTLGASGATLKATLGTGALTLTGGISGSSTGNLTKTGEGTVIIPGTSSWNTGANSVTVSDGILQAGFGTNGISALTVEATGNMNFTNSATPTLTLGSTGIVLTLRNGARLGFELDGTANDALIVPVGGLLSFTGGFDFDFFNLNAGVMATTYNLISAPAGSALNSFNYSVLNTPGGGFNYVINKTDTLVSLTTSVLSNRYWTDVQGTGSWSTLGVGPLSNFSTDSGGLTNSTALPVAADTVVFSATTVAATNIATTLDAPFAIDSLQFSNQPAGLATVSIDSGVGGVASRLTLAPVTATNGILVASGGGAVTIGAPVIVGAPQTWTVNGTGTSSLAISGNVTFTSAVTKSGAGALTLSGPTNSGAGGLTLAGGTLDINSTTALGTGTFTIGAGTTINASAGAIVNANNNVQIWDGNFTFTGSNDLNLGTGAVTMGDNVELTASGSTLIVGGAIGESGVARTLTKAGNGTLVLTGNSTYSGGTTLSAGTLNINASGTSSTNSAIGTGTFTITGGTIDNTSGSSVTLVTNNALALNGNFAFAGTNNLNLGTGAVTTNGARTVTVSNNTLTFGGSFTPSTAAASHLTKLGAGTLTLNGTTAMGNNGLIVNGGIVRFGGILTTNTGVGAGGSTFRVGNLANASAAFVQTGGTITLSVTDVDGMNLGNADSASGAFGSLTIASGAFTAPRINVGGSGLTVGTNGVGLFSVLNGATAKFNNWFIGGRGAGNTGSATIAGGTLDLTSLASNTGVFGGGRFEINLGPNLGGSNTGGTFDAGTKNISTVANGAGSQGIINLLGGTLTANAVNTLVTATGAGINQFNFNGGTLKYGGSVAQASFLTGLAGATAASGAFVRSGGATIDDNAQAITIAANLLAPTGGEVTGITTSATGFFTAPYVKIVGGNNDATAVAIIDGAGAVTSIVITNPGSGYSTAPTVTLVGGTTAGGTDITAAATATVGSSTSGGLTKQGAGTLTLSGASTYTGKTTVSAGTLSFNTIANVGGGASALGAPTTAADGTIDLNGTLIYTGAVVSTDRVVNLTNALTGSTINNSGSGLLTLNGDVTGSATNLLFRGAGSITMNGLIGATYAGNVTHTDASTLTLTNTGNAWTGNLLVSAGIVSANTIADKNVASAIGAGTVITLGQSGFNNTGTFQFTGASGGSSNREISIQSNLGNTNGGVIENTVVGQLLTLSGGITVGGTGLTPSLGLTGAGNGLLSGNISGSPALDITKSGTGTWTLPGANTYTGINTITAGTLQVNAASGGLGNSTAVNAINLNAGTLSLRNDGAGNNGSILYASTSNPSGYKVQLTVSSTVNVDNLTANTGNTIALGALTQATAAIRTLNVTGANGYSLTLASLALNPGTGQNTTLNPTTASLIITGNVINPMSGFGASNFDTLTLGGTNTGNSIGGSITDAVGGSIAAGGTTRLTKSNTSTWTLSGLSATAASNYTGITTLDQGTLAITHATTAAFTGGLTFGAAAGNTNTSTLDLTGANVTIGGALLTQNNNTVADTIIIGPGKTLTVNGNVTIGQVGVPTVATTPKLTMNGGGSLNVTTAAAGVIQIGGSNGGTTGNLGENATLDLAGLATATLNVSATGTIRVNNPQAGNTSGVQAALLLPTPAVVNSTPVTTITAANLNVGDAAAFNSSATQINQVVLGTGLTTLNVNTINVGTGNRDIGSITFANANGNLMVRGAAGGVTRSILNIGTGGATTGTTNASLNDLVDLTGHSADLLLTALNVGNQARVGNMNYDFKFDTGTLDATTVTAGFRTGTATTTATLNSTITLGGGTVTIGTGGLEIGNSSYTNTGVTALSGTVNVSGGTVTIANSATFGAAVRMSTNSGGATNAANVTSLLNITGGAVTLAGNIIRGTVTGTQPNTAAVTLNGGTLNMGGNNIGVTGNIVSLNAQGGTLQNLGQLNGGGTLTKSTAGTLFLSGANAYTGLTDVTAGRVRVQSATGLGGTAGATSVTGGANLQIENFDVGAENLTLNGAGLAGEGALSATGTAADSGTVLLASDSTIGVATLGDTLALSGAISGTGASGLTKVGNGTLTLTNTNNTYTGATTVSAGTLQVNGGGAIANAGLVTLADVAGATFQVVGSETIGALSGGGATGGAVSIDASQTLSLASGTQTYAGAISGSGTLTNSGAIQTLNGALSHSGGVNVTAGLLTISGSSNTYTGGTTVSDGTLVVNGSISGSTSVNSGGTLGGSGGTTGAVTVALGGTFAPGGSIGTLNTGALAFSNGAFDLEINTTAITSDLANVTGNLSLLGGATLNISDFNVSSTPLSIGQVFTFIDYSGMWDAGIFAGYADDSQFTLGLNDYRISYNGVDNATSAVTLEVVPEPGSAVLLLGGIAALAGFRRRRRVVEGCMNLG